MKSQNEYEKRCKAIQPYKEGYGFNRILQLVQRSKGWLSKWLKRFKEHDLEGQYVVATVFTHRKRLVVKQDKIIKSFSSPLKGNVIAPLLRYTKSKP